MHKQLPSNMNANKQLVNGERCFHICLDSVCLECINSIEL